MSHDDISRLDSLSKGFRARYLKYDDLVAQMRAWCDAFPSLCRMESLGETPEGRPLWLLTVGPEPDRARPSVWVDGNMHASEVAGSSVALGLAEDALRLHLDPSDDSDFLSLPGHTLAALRAVRWFILPRMSPDGAEAVLSTGRYVRSVPRDRRTAKLHARWVHRDLDGDGLALVMRREDPTGEFAESPEHPGLLVPRTLDDPGPYYKVYPEGMIENYDGRSIPDPYFLQDNDVDLNRNFPWSWAPEPRQAGAGAWPASEPETLAVVRFVTAHPEIFAWLNLHTFGGVFIRPYGDKPDHKMPAEDLGVWRQIGEWGARYTGYPMVSGFEEFLYEPEKPLHGDLTDYGYHHRGTLAYVCELWDIFHQLGIERKKPFVDHYTTMTRKDFVKLAKWDHQHNASRIVRPWRRFEHPQLGPVELGGVDPRVGIWNPPYDQLGSVCRAQAMAFFRVAAMAPRLSLAEVTQRPLGDDLTAITVRVQNLGYLSTYVVAEAKDLPHNEAPYLQVFLSDTQRLFDDTPHPISLGHLQGWGRGLYGASTLFFLRSRGSVSEAEARVIVRGRGEVRLRVGSSRVGFVERTVTLADRSDSSTSG